MKYEYPELIEKFMALPLKRAKQVAIDTLQSQQTFLFDTEDPDYIDEWQEECQDEIEYLIEELEYLDKSWTHEELLETISKFEEDPSVALYIIDFKDTLLIKDISMKRAKVVKLKPQPKKKGKVQK